MTDKLEQLAALAKVATPGPWAVDGLWVRAIQSGNKTVCKILGRLSGSNDDAREVMANATFIAAASPDVIAALVAEVLAARAVADDPDTLRDDYPRETSRQWGLAIDRTDAALEAKDDAT